MKKRNGAPTKAVRNQRIVILVSAQEKQDLQQEAEAAHMQLATLCRHRLLMKEKQK